MAASGMACSGNEVVLSASGFDVSGSAFSTANASMSGDVSALSCSGIAGSASAPSFTTSSFTTFSATAFSSEGFSPKASSLDSSSFAAASSPPPFGSSGWVSPSNWASSVSLRLDCNQIGFGFCRSGTALNWLLNMGSSDSPIPFSNSI